MSCLDDVNKAQSLLFQICTRLVFGLLSDLMSNYREAMLNFFSSVCIHLRKLETYCCQIFATVIGRTKLHTNVLELKACKLALLTHFLQK